MAKKQKGGRTSSKLASIGQANFRTKVQGESPISKARRFGPYNWMVESDHRLGEWVVEVNEEGIICPEGHREILEKAEHVLGGNVCSRRKAADKPDVAWVEARWAHPEGTARLDPHRTFEVGVAKARKPRSPEDCAAKARFLEIVDPAQLPEGLTMLPNEEGNHLQVTLLGILLNRGLLEVFREGELVGKATIWDGLCGFTEQQREFFSRPTKGEERRKAAEDKKATELRREKRAAARAERKVKEAAEREAAEVEALTGLFDQVVERAEEEALEAELAEKRAKWDEFVASSPTLLKAWEEATEIVAKAYAEQEGRIAAYCALFRPAAPTSSLGEAGAQVYRDLITEDPDTAKGRWANIGAWVVETHKKRRGGTLEESLGAVQKQFPTLLGEWFRETPDGMVPWGPLDPIQGYSRDAWVGIAGWHPGIAETMKQSLLDLGGVE